MKTSGTRQATRLLALAVATGTMVATATSAGAATSHTKHQLVGKAQTDVVQVSLNLPAATPLVSELPKLANLDLSKPITLNLIHTIGELSRNQIKGLHDAGQSTAALGSGTLFDKGGLLAPINRAVTASISRPGSFHPAQSVVNFAEGPLSVTVPTLTASAKRNLLGTGGLGRLAGLDLGKLTDLLPAGSLDALNAALGKLVTDPNSPTGTVTDTVDQLLGQIKDVLDKTPAGTLTHKVLSDLQKQIKGLQKELPKLVASLENGSIVDLKALTSLHNITTTAHNAVSSKAGVSLAHLSLLGGFVTLDGFDNSAKVTANGLAHGAHAVVNPNLAKVHIGAPVGLDLVLGPNGLAANLLGSKLPASITKLVNTLVKQIQNVLATAGVRIAPASYNTTYNADHSAVAVTGSGLEILVNSLTNRTNTNFSKALVGVRIGAYSASAGAKAVTFTPQHNPTHPTVTPHHPFSHPDTGANYPLTAGAALALLTGAALIRRRMIADKA
jgi:hypothetical protein